MGKLYIIGNGFDLHFGLKTAVSDFKTYLAGEEVYDKSLNALDVFGVYGINWGDYEQSLINMELDAIEDENELGPDYLSDRETDRDGGILNMQMVVDSLSDSVRSALHKMVLDANHALEQKEPIASPIFKAGDAILSFNYTSTIETLFTMPDSVPICHLHGYVEDGTELIFGYKDNKTNHRHNWADLGEDGDYYLQQQRSIVYRFYQCCEKPLQLKKLKEFLWMCKGIDHVVVLGHSMQDVDSDYMELIEHTFSPDSWEISCYNGYPNMDSLQSYSFFQKIHIQDFDKLLFGKT